MLLVFEKWDKFVANGCEKYLLQNLNEALEHSSYSLLSLFFAAGKVVAPKETQSRRNAFDWDILGFLRLSKPPKYVEETIGEDRWNGFMKILQVVDSDYKLKQSKEEFFYILKREYSDAVQSISEWEKL